MADLRKFTSMTKMVGTKAAAHAHDGSNGWEERHRDAVMGWGNGSTHERAFLTMLNAWELYAISHMAKHEQKISGCYVTGPIWAEMGAGFIEMLNLDHGPRLDGGLLDTTIRKIWEEHGFDENGAVEMTTARGGAKRKS